jgi:hypothetical protein
MRDKEEENETLFEENLNDEEVVKKEITSTPPRISAQKKKKQFFHNHISDKVPKITLQNKYVQNWTLSDALEFLVEHHLEMYKEKFTENYIDGEVI